MRHVFQFFRIVSQKSTLFTSAIKKTSFFDLDINYHGSQKIAMHGIGSGLWGSGVAGYWLLVAGCGIGDRILEGGKVKSEQSTVNGEQ
jgi:hypothetical protein